MTTLHTSIQVYLAVSRPVSHGGGDYLDGPGYSVVTLPKPAAPKTTCARWLIRLVTHIVLIKNFITSASRTTQSATTQFTRGQCHPAFVERNIYSSFAHHADE